VSKEIPMRHVPAFLSILAVLALVALPAGAQARGAAVGDVVLFHVGDETRPAIVVTSDPLVLHVFLTPSDVEKIVLGARGAEAAGRTQKPAITTRSGRALPCSGTSVVVEAADEDWTSR